MQMPSMCSLKDAPALTSEETNQAMISLNARPTAHSQLTKSTSYCGNPMLKDINDFMEVMTRSSKPVAVPQPKTRPITAEQAKAKLKATRR